MFVAGDKVWEKPFTPLSLFSSGELGAWFNPSDLSSMFQDAAGTIPASYGQPVGMIRDKSGNGNHASQETSTARPTLGRVPVGGRRNTLMWTENLEQAYWAKARAKVDPDATTDPFGAITADLLRETVDNGEHFVDRNVAVTVGQIYTWSSYARLFSMDREIVLRTASAAGSNRIVLNLQTGIASVTENNSVLSWGCVDVGGWYRLWITATAVSNGTGVFRRQLRRASDGQNIYAGSTSSGVYLWGAQLEAGATLTPYQRVTTDRDVTEDGVQSLTYLYRDPVDDALPWTAPAGSYDIVHIPLTGPATVLTAQALSGSTNILLAENTRAYLAIDRRLTAAEIDALAARYGTVISDFPAIAGDYVHYRQEDVTEAGVTAANGLPLSLDFEGVLSRVTVAGVEWMDCSTGILRVERAPWPSDIGMSIWVLTDGSRPSGTVLYNGLRTAGLNDNRHLNFHGGGIFRTTNNSTRTAIWPVPAADGPETMCWSVPQGESTIGGYSLRHNGIDLGPSTMTDPTRAATRNGPDFVIGAGSNLVPTGLRWRDVVLKIGAPLTEQEIADLEVYAAARVTP